MASITRQQAHDRQARAPEGWLYNIEHYVFWGEHQLTKYIKLGGDDLVMCDISYNYENILSLYVTYARRDGDFITSGTGYRNKTVHLGEPVARKSYKAICKAAEGFTESDLLKILC